MIGNKYVKTMKTIAFVEVMRCFATLFVLNSHYEGVYPIPLDIGGELGLAIFFLLTGYLTVNIRQETNFGDWILRRLIRIYTPLFIWQTSLVLINYRGGVDLSFGELFRIYIYPTRYWYVSYILLVYVIFYFMFKYIFLEQGLIGMKHLLIGLVLIFLVLYYCIENEFNTFKMQTYSLCAKVCWLFCVVLGFVIRKNEEKYKGRKIKEIYLFWGIVFLVLYGFMKIVMTSAVNNPKLYYFQCLPTVFSITCACFMFFYFRSLESSLQNIREKIKLIRIVEIISKSSIEIYIVQFAFIEMFVGVIFPLNWILMTFFSIAVGYCLHLVIIKLF